LSIKAVNMKLCKLCFFFLFFATTGYAQQISLNGTWTVKLENNPGKAYAVKLPGTLDDAGIGDKVVPGTGMNFSTMAHLTRKVQYVGKAYYSNTFTVPAGWKQKEIVLKLGRVLWKSSVTIDGRAVEETGESLVTANEFNVTRHIEAGKKQTITICIDNSNIFPGINVYATQYPSKESSEIAHSYTNHTQIKWNGILGEISLIAKPKLFAEQVIITADVHNKSINIGCRLSEANYKEAQLQCFIADAQTGRKWVKTLSQSVTGKTVTASIPFDNNVTYWSEFTPKLYQLVTIIMSEYGSDTAITSFGIRDFKEQDQNLYLNDSRIFIRGNLECIIFPLTGYPPMTQREWETLFNTAKSYGLNEFRFHSWCPPEAAFAAADKTGFYLQVELPNWNLKMGEDTASFSFLRREAHRILKAYGNHPSFMFFSMGNELEGDFGKLNALVAELKATDKRHLYSTTTFTFQKEITGNPQPQDDYYVTQWTKKGWVRGQGVFNDLAPDFSKDYVNSLGDIKVPIITHEIGQYSVYPDISEIKEYKGNLVPVNFMTVRDALAKNGLSDLAPAYLNASGKFATLLYKEEIERALKTKGLDGFQLLQMQDFPGQGTALVGILNAFWKTKGFVTAKDFRKYCSEVTPLIRFAKPVYTSNETFEADVELANFYKPLKNTGLVWNIKEENGKLLKSGAFGKKDYEVDNGLQVGTISFSLNNILSAKKLVVEVMVKGTTYRNEWNIWVYPAGIKEEQGNVLVTNSLRDALGALEKGEKVLLCPAPDTLKGPKGKFVPVFWSPVHFPDNPGTMGLLIKSKHKALADFPTDNHSNWQWWDLTTKAKALNVGTLPDDANIVRQIDNFVTNNNLSSLFEVNVGKGQLLFCGINIVADLDKRPQARQLRYSLLKYMNGSSFKPAVRAEAAMLKGLFKMP
jgi:Glycosyl hydrolases family 2, sugar binding domain/Glycosyl hydrolases family 2